MTPEQEVAEYEHRISEAVSKALGHAVIVILPDTITDEEVLEALKICQEIEIKEIW